MMGMVDKNSAYDKAVNTEIIHIRLAALLNHRRQLMAEIKSVGLPEDRKYYAELKNAFDAVISSEAKALTE